jgi:predicted flavoprotein YhiN
MVINYGMSDIGPWSLLDPSAQSGDVVMRMMARNSMSENLQQRIDDAVKRIAEEAYEVALKHIRENRCVQIVSDFGGCCCRLRGGARWWVGCVRQRGLLLAAHVSRCVRQPASQSNN